MNLAVLPVKQQSIFRMDGYCVWDPSLVRDDAGKCHLFFSRWPIDKGFEAWVTHSEVCRAEAETPLGPYHFAEVVFPKRAGFWDGDVTHNPQIKKFAGKYYLYYNGNYGDGQTWWSHRNHQRVGLAVADRPEGPWLRFDQPLIDVTPGAWDAVVTTNPSCAQGADGRFIMVYKGVGDKNPAPFYGPVQHGVAYADKPEGPFVKSPGTLFDADSDFPGEDPFIWIQAGRYYALLKDNASFYSPESRAIVRFESGDGKKWLLAKNPVLTSRLLKNEDGNSREIFRLERPYLYLEDSKPSVLFCAAKPDKDKDHAEIIAMQVAIRELAQNKQI